MSAISHRSTKTSPKVDKTIARKSATFRRLPKTTKNFEVAGGRQPVVPSVWLGLKDHNCTYISWYKALNFFKVPNRDHVWHMNYSLKIIMFHLKLVHNNTILKTTVFWVSHRCKIHLFLFKPIFSWTTEHFHCNRALHGLKKGPQHHSHFCLNIFYLVKNTLSKSNCTCMHVFSQKCNINVLILEYKEKLILALEYLQKYSAPLWREPLPK